MHKSVIITDTSCLIVLTKINALILLRQLYQQIIITKEIAEEYGEALPDWILIRTVNNTRYQTLLEGSLDKGESSAIALALEISDALLVIDDLKARKEAKRLGLNFTGTLGILSVAKQNGYIPAIKPYIECIQNSNFRIAPQIIDALLSLHGEHI